MKRRVAILLTLAMLLTLVVPAYGAQTGLYVTESELTYYSTTYLTTLDVPAKANIYKSIQAKPDASWVVIGSKYALFNNYTGIGSLVEGADGILPSSVLDAATGKKINPVTGEPIPDIAVDKVEVTNGTITVTMTGDGTPLETDFDFGYKIGDQSKPFPDLAVSNFIWNADTKTATFTFEPFVATSQEQSIAICYQFKGKGGWAVEPIIVSAADTTAPAIAAEGNVVTDYKTLTVAFTEKVTGTPAVKVNGTDEPAANVALAADGMTMTITRTAGFAPGSYAVVVNGLSDMASNVMMANASVTITKAPSYISSFAVTTTGLPNTAGQKVYFTVADQFGQDITSTIGSYDANLKVSASYADTAYPVAINHTSGQNYAVITDELTKDKTLTVVLINTNAKGVELAKNSANIAISGVTPVATSIASITIGSATQTAGTTNIALTANVKDQLGNACTLANGAKIRWTTSDETIATIDADSYVGETIVNAKSWDGAAGDVNMKVKALAEGTATIKAFLPNGTQVVTPLVITVNQGTLNTIVAANANITVTNKATVTGANIAVNANTGVTLNFQNSLSNNIGIAASHVTFTVKDSLNNAVSSDIVNIEKVANANGILTGLKVSTARTEQNTATITDNPSKVYTVTVSAAGKTATFTITSTIDTTVAAIDDITFNENQLTVVTDNAANNVIKSVVFRNQYNEAIDVKYSGISIGAQPNNVKVDAYKNATITVINGDSVTHLGFRGLAKGSYNAVIIAGGCTKVVPMTVVSAATIDSIATASTISVINNDKAATDEMRVNDGTDTYLIQEITIKDQFKNTLTAVAPDDLNVTGTTANYQVKFFKADKTVISGATPGIAYVGFNAKNLDPLPTTPVTITIAKNGDATKKAEVAVSVTADRVVNILAITPSSGNALVNIPVTYTLSGVDQYGVAVDLNESLTKLQTLANVSIGDKVANSANSKNSDFSLTASAAGTYTATIYYDANNNDALDAGEKTTTVTLVAETLANAVASIAIQSTVTVANTTDANGKYDTASYTVPLAAGDADQTVTFTVKAYDANNNQVIINQASDVVYAVQTNSIKSAPTITLDKNVAKVDMTGKQFNLGDSFTVKATSLNGKTSTLVVNVADITSSAVQSGKYYLADEATGATPLTTIELKESDNTTTNGLRIVHLVGIDQFGKKKDINETTVIFAQDDSQYFTKTATASGLQIVAKVAGTTNLRVFIEGNQEIVIPVTVQTDAAQAPSAIRAAQQILGSNGTVASGNAEGTNLTATVTNVEASLKDTFNVADVYVALTNNNVVPTSVTIPNNPDVTFTNLTDANSVIAQAGDIKAALTTYAGVAYDSATLAKLQGKSAITAVIGGVNYTFAIN